MNSKSILLQYNKDLERPVRFRIVYYAYSNEEGFIGYEASNDDYINKVPYWNNKDGFLEILGAEKTLYDDGDYITTEYSVNFSAFNNYRLNYATL